MIDRVRIKICGLTRPSDMEHAVRCGADFVGVVFANSPRRVDERVLASWLEDARGDAEVVGVFRDQEIEHVLECIERFDLDFVQLHGDERGEAWTRLPVRMIEARIVRGDVPSPSRFGGAAWAELLDSGAGSGASFDWGAAQAPALARRLFLAGGLHHENVVEAIEQVAPFAVDASSRLESEPGRKDPNLVEAFCRAVRAREES